MSKVVSINGPAADPDVVLENAKGEYSELMVIGWNNNDELEARATNLTVEQALLLIEKFKYNLMSNFYGTEEEDHQE